MNERPPIQRWWATYILVGAGAVVALIAAIDAVARFLAPLAHLGLVVLLAIVVAFILAPLVTRLERLIHRRVPAVVITFLLVLVLLVGLLALVAAPLVTESSRLADQIPQYVAQLQSSAPVTIFGYRVPDEVRVQAGAALGGVGGALAAQAVTVVVGLVSGIVDVFLVLIIALYLLLDARRIRTGALRALPKRQREQVESVEVEVARVFGAYVRGQLVLAVIVGVAATVVLLLLGVPYALVLGIFAGMAELIPMLGPILGAVPAVLVALFQPFPLVLWVVLAFIVIQQLESNVLVPRISGHAVGLHPLATPLDEATNLLQQLIRNKCVNDGTPDSGGEVRNAQTLGAYLAGPGLDIKQYESHPGRGSMSVRIEGSDKTAPTLLMMGHIDVVPADPIGWKRDPFCGDLIDGEVWGRGALDMLSITVTMAVAVKKLVREGWKPRGTLIFSGMADEDHLGGAAHHASRDEERDAEDDAEQERRPDPDPSRDRRGEERASERADAPDGEQHADRRRRQTEVA